MSQSSQLGTVYLLRLGHISSCVPGLASQVGLDPSFFLTELTAVCDMLHVVDTLRCFFKKRCIILIFYICVFVYHIHAWCPQRPEESIGSSGTRVKRLL
jgi:hypothetical protein